MQKKRQHYVPESYLKAWCDPDTPRGQTPYVWLFSPDGRSQKKAPEKIFYESDLYTVTTKEVARDVTVEDNLSRLESEFVKIRKR